MGGRPAKIADQHFVKILMFVWKWVDFDSSIHISGSSPTRLVKLLLQWVASTPVHRGWESRAKRILDVFLQHHIEDIESRQHIIKHSMTTVYYSDSAPGHISLTSLVENRDSARLEYLAEGNANIVYSFKETANNVLPHGFHHKLLRLRKDKSFIQPTKSQFETFQQEFVPLFRPENLVEQTLITLDEALIRKLNQELEQHENAKFRKSLRHGDRLATDEYGLLITDMTARHGEYLFEIKPKWLLQSPDAPGGSIRCRTCALRLQRNHAAARGAVMPKSGGFCPLSLVEDDIQERQRAFRSIIEAQAGNLSDDSGTFLSTSDTRSLSYTPSLLHIVRFFTHHWPSCSGNSRQVSVRTGLSSAGDFARAPGTIW